MEINKKLTLENSDLLKLLSNPVRLCIVHHLAYSDSCNVSHFVNCMDASQPNISQHLAKLKSANIVTVEKKGNEVYYSLVDDKARKIVDMLFNN